jgi:hypothetical protein
MKSITFCFIAFSCLVNYTNKYALRQYYLTMRIMFDKLIVMKTLVLIMLISSSLIADVPTPSPSLDELLKVESSHMPTLIVVVVEQKSVLPDWAWFALGAFVASGTLSFFYYNRK